MQPGYLYSHTRYERKLVAFYDVLGWRKKIEWAENDPGRLSLLATILRMNAMMENVSSIEKFPQQFTSFSDNVVMSMSPTARTLDEVLFRLGCGQFAAAILGFYMRGAVTIGDIIHDDYVVFGPALNRAYELESRVAIFPRIILDPDIIPSLGPLPSFIACEDGIHFIDPFTQSFAARIEELSKAGVHEPTLAALGVPLPTDRYRGHPNGRLVAVGTTLRQALSEAPNEEAFTKLAWLVKRLH